MSVAFRPKLCPKCRRHDQGEYDGDKVRLRPTCKRPPPAKSRGIKGGATYTLHVIEPFRYKADCSYFTEGEPGTWEGEAV